MSISLSTKYHYIVLHRPPPSVEKVPAPKNAFLECAANGSVQEVQLLLDSGANIHTRDALGLSALHYAAYRGKIDLFDLLYKNGANIALVNSLGETALTQAKKMCNKELYTHAKTLNRAVYAYSKEVHLRKHLAHLLNIAGTTTLNHPDPKIVQSITLPLEGWHPSSFWNLIHKRTGQFFKEHPNSAGEFIIELCKSATDISLETPAALFNRYRNERKPIIIKTGYKAHSSTIILWGGFYVVCERGSPSRKPFTVKTIDKQKVDVAFIEELLSLKKKPEEAYCLHLKTVVEKYLTPTQLFAAIELSRLMLVPPLEVGNCAWANSAAAVYALLVLHSLRSYAALPPSQQISLEQLCTTQKALFDKWEAYVIKSEVEKYVSCHLTNPELHHPDPEFIQKVQKKLPKEQAELLNSLKAHSLA